MVTFGNGVPMSLRAARALERAGVRSTVLDLRWLSPLPMAAVAEAAAGFDRVLVQATDRALSGPELQLVIEHVAASPEVRAALQQQSTTLAQEMAEGLRSKAESLDEVADQLVL